MAMITYRAFLLATKHSSNDASSQAPTTTAFGSPRKMSQGCPLTITLHHEASLPASRSAPIYAINTWISKALESKELLQPRLGEEQGRLKYIQAMFLLGNVGMVMDQIDMHPIVFIGYMYGRMNTVMLCD
ncbi:hypothetical protein Scep_002016 [Stephania cephalantha]|uniref:Uncharacterized protein n=1 Tax=Stephania cephalantha TaxID=152367 RepID=A0AAP0Q4A7_9MAGN